MGRSSDGKDEKDENRANFPTCAAFLDEMREIFGADTRMVWAEENGKQVGNKGTDGVRPVIERKQGK